MTPTDQGGWLTERLAQTSDRASDSTCPHCHSPVIRARAGRVAALDVVADPEPITATEEILALLGGRLTWHLITGALGHRRITWRGTSHIRAGPARHPVLADHTCPPQPVQERLL